MKRDKLKIILWIHVLFVYLFSCSGNRNRSEFFIREQKMDYEIQQFIEQWKIDSLGCLKLRSKEKAEAIIDSLKLENTSHTELLRVFGKPNVEKERYGVLTLSYYFDALCANGVFIDSADYCIVEFTVIENKLKQRNYICH